MMLVKINNGKAGFGGAFIDEYVMAVVNSMIFLTEYFNTVG